MSDFKVKMHQIRFRLGPSSAPDSAGEAYSTPPDPLAGFKGRIFPWRAGPWTVSIVERQKSAANYATIISVQGHHCLLIEIKLCNVIIGGKTGGLGENWGCPRLKPRTAPVCDLTVFHYWHRRIVRGATASLRNQQRLWQEYSALQKYAVNERLHINIK